MLQKGLEKIELFAAKNIFFRQHFFYTLIAAPLSFFFKSGVYLRNVYFNFFSKKTKNLLIPIVCVGNIRVGGSGKSPFVQMLLNDLKELNHIGVVYTGYKSLGVKKNRVLSPKNTSGELVEGNFCGDEAKMIQTTLDQLSIFVCKNRLLSVEKAKERGCELLIFDDGFQDKKIYKNFTILMIDPSDELIKPKFLPYGCYRDFPSELAKADLLCIKQDYSQESLDAQKLSALEAKIKTPIILCQDNPLGVFGDLFFNLEQIKDKKVALFSAISNPERFFKTIEKLGASIVYQRFFPDHHPITETLVEQILKESQVFNPDTIICTEKDYAKIPKKKFSRSISFLKMRMNVVHGRKDYEALLDKIKIQKELYANKYRSKNWTS